ncbi:hypothetical protein [Pedobacter panaciterrae]
MEEIQQKELEQNIINILLDRGMEFNVPKRSILRHFSKKKERTFVLHESFLGTLDLLTDQYLKLEINEKALQENVFLESDRIIKMNNKRAARIVAIAWLNKFCYVPVIPLVWGFHNYALIWLASNYFQLRLKPSKLLKITTIIRQLMNSADFTLSIRLMMAIQRTSQPKADLVEEKQKV